MAQVEHKMMSTITRKEDELDPTLESHALGGDHDALQQLIHTCNADGMQCLHNGNVEKAFDNFRYAEAMLLTNNKDYDFTPFLAVTCNNLACYYNKVGKFHGSLVYLRRALKLEVQMNTDSVTLAGTHLNICQVLSKLEKHAKALQHALRALDLMSKTITDTRADTTEDEASVLTLCYYNIAGQRANLKEWDQAATYFQTGYQVANRLLGATHQLSISMEKHCEEALMKANAVKAKSRNRRYSSRREESNDNDSTIALPPIHTPRKSSDHSDAYLHPGSSEGAYDWKKSEEAAWNAFSKFIVTDSVPEKIDFPSATQPPGSGQSGGLVSATQPPKEASDYFLQVSSRYPRTIPRNANALLHLRLKPLDLPKASNMGTYRFNGIGKSTTLKKLPLVHALDANPDALLDILDLDGERNDNLNDYRPNRAVNRASRTARLLRHSGIQNSSHHRDAVAHEIAQRQKSHKSKGKGKDISLQAQFIAAVKIQKVWRLFAMYCKTNSQWMTVRWICATMIQSHWRSYHVRRKYQDKHARAIQRHIRGALVRRFLKRHASAVTIQKRVVGMITRRKLKDYQRAAMVIQRLTRGVIMRNLFTTLKNFKLGIIIYIQGRVRVWLAKKRVDRIREERNEYNKKVKCATDMQRYYRGWKGREIASERAMELALEQKEHLGALKIQLLFRMRQARKRMKIKQMDHHQHMHIAATNIQRVWLGQRTRKQYARLKRDYAGVVNVIITLQRYMRGCMCRVKLWRQAVETEELVWAAVSIQRVWRGYLGKVRWETAYEMMWRRELAAAVIQRNIRGWLARILVRNRMRQKFRKEFEYAKRRHRASVRIQALARGVLVRSQVRSQWKAKSKAAIQIQRIARGRALRRRLWQQILVHRAIIIQASMRGCLVRNRRFKLISKVILIQRCYRHWLRVPLHLRRERLEQRRRRQAAATTIQRKVLEFTSSRKVQRIKANDCIGTTARPS